jgi:hypothetical protein
MIDFILNIKSIKKDSIIISGIATSNRLDAHGESITISPNAYKTAITEYNKKDGKVYDNNHNPVGLVIAYEHEPIDHEKQIFTTNNIKNSKKIRGMTLETEYYPKDYTIDSPQVLKMAIKFVAEIWDQELIKDIIERRVSKASLNWKTLNWLINSKTKQRIDTEVQLNELSLVRVPANPDAVFSVVTDESLAKQYKLGERVKVFDTIGNVKTVYVDSDNHYYVDIEFEDEIINIKTASKIPFELLDIYKVNIIYNYKVNIKRDIYNNYPQSARNNVQKAISWKEKYGDEVNGGTQIGWTRAGQLARGENLSVSTVKKIKSFLARHEKNASVTTELKDTPWKDAGYVAYMLWGGKSMKNWVDSLSL